MVPLGDGLGPSRRSDISRLWTVHMTCVYIYSTYVCMHLPIIQYVYVRYVSLYTNIYIYIYIISYVYISLIILIMSSYAAKRLNDLDAAERALTHALALDSVSEVALYHLAALLHRKLRYKMCDCIICI